MAGDDWRCRRHPAPPCGGVCPHCLRDRLLRLCPDCARDRPCACATPSSASSPSSSSSAASASALGRVQSLIDRDRRVARSRSVVAGRGGLGDAGGDDPRRAKSRVWGWVSFRKPAPPVCRDVEEEYDDAVALARSRSVSAAADAAATAKGTSKGGGWGRLIPGKIKALRNRKSGVR
ncbi:hypothetical protein ACP70R_010222 [Stipagrostis hirtigluma subsp. patula]